MREPGVFCTGACKRNDNKLRFYSMNFEDRDIIESSLEDLKPYNLRLLRFSSDIF